MAKPPTKVVRPVPELELDPEARVAPADREQEQVRVLAVLADRDRPVEQMPMTTNT